MGRAFGAGALQAQVGVDLQFSIGGVNNGGGGGQRDRAAQDEVAFATSGQSERPEAGVGDGVFSFFCRVRQGARPGEAQVLCEYRNAADGCGQPEDKAAVFLHSDAARLAGGGAKRADFGNPQAGAVFRGCVRALDRGRARVGVRVREREPARAADDEVGAARAVGGFLNDAREGVVGAGGGVYREGIALLDLDSAARLVAAQAADGLALLHEQLRAGAAQIHGGIGEDVDGSAAFAGAVEFECAAGDIGLARVAVVCLECEPARALLGQAARAGDAGVPVLGDVARALQGNRIAAIVDFAGEGEAFGSGVRVFLKTEVAAQRVAEVQAADGVVVGEGVGSSVVLGAREGARART